MSVARFPRRRQMSSFFDRCMSLYLSTYVSFSNCLRFRPRVSLDRFVYLYTCRAIGWCVSAVSGCLCFDGSLHG